MIPGSSLGLFDAAACYIVGRYGRGILAPGFDPRSDSASSDLRPRPCLNGARVGPRVALERPPSHVGAAHGGRASGARGAREPLKCRARPAHMLQRVSVTFAAVERHMSCAVETQIALQ